MHPTPRHTDRLAPAMPDIRCGQCRRKLGEGVYSRLTIKCPRCRTLNFLRAERPPSERHSTPSHEGNHDASPSPSSAQPR